MMLYQRGAKFLARELRELMEPEVRLEVPADEPERPPARWPLVQLLSLKSLRVLLEIRERLAA